MQWVRLAKTQRLDVYTCLGLSNGKENLGRETLAFVPLLVLLIVMQFILPIMLIFVETKGVNYPTEQDPLFRLIGFILYLYSVLTLYEGARDECRFLFLEMALSSNKVSWSYVLPMLFGECLNSFTALLLARTLYLIFIDSHRPLDLLIKCIAINFVILIDNEWTSEHMRQQALENFSMFYKKLKEEELHMSFTLERGFKFYLQVAVKWTCTLARAIGIGVIGGSSAFLFLLGNHDDLCRRINHNVWPICIPGGSATEMSSVLH